MRQNHSETRLEAPNLLLLLRGPTIALLGCICFFWLLTAVAGDRVFASSPEGWTSNGIGVAVATGDQDHCRTAPDGNGGTLLVWEDSRGDHKTVFAQRLSPAGRPLWAYEGVPVSDAPSDQSRPQVVSDGNGGAIVTWYDERNGNADVFAQRIDQGGDIAWSDPGGIPVATGTPAQSYPQIIAYGAGEVVIVWEEETAPANLDLLAQRIDANGGLVWSSPVAICTELGIQDSPRLALLDPANPGDVVVTWQDQRNGDSDVYAQRLDADGNTLWTSNGEPIASGTGEQTAPIIVPDGNGGMIIGWQTNATGSWDIGAQLIDGAGSGQWPGGGTAISQASGDQTEPALAGDGMGGALLTWQDGRGASADIFAQRVDAQGNVLWTVDGNPVCMASGNQTEPVIVSNGTGGAVVSWKDTRNADLDIYAQILDQSGAATRTPDGIGVCVAVNDQDAPAITANSVGGAVVSWTDRRSGSRDVYAMRVGPVTVQGRVAVDYFYAPGEEFVSFGLDGVTVHAIEEGTGTTTDQVVTSSPTGFPEDWGRYTLTVNEGWSGRIEVSDVPYPMWNARNPKTLIYDPINTDQIVDFTLTHQSVSTWPEDGLPVTQTNEPVAGPFTITDGTGGMIAGWLDFRNGQWDIFVQRVYKDGDAFWGPGGVPLCTASGDRTWLQLAPNGYEGAVACWLDNRSGSWDVYAQTINGWGDPVWEENGRLVAQAVSNQSPPVIATDAAGAPTIVYQRGTDIFARVQSLDHEIAICTATGEQVSPTITYNPPGQVETGAVITWVDRRTDSEGDIYAEGVDYWTNDVGSNWPANGRAVCTATGAQSAVFSIYDDLGGAYLTWLDSRSGDTDIYAQRISKDGLLWWSSSGVPICTAPGLQTSQHAIGDGQGGMIVVWQDWRDAGNADIYAQRTNPYGAVQWTTDGVQICGATANQTEPRIAHDGSGNFVITWTDERSGTKDIYAQRIDVYGNLLGQPDGFPVNTEIDSQSRPQPIGDRVSDFGTYVAWLDSRSGVTNIYADRIKAAHSISGHVLDATGAGVEGVTVNAIEQRDLLSLVPSVSKTTDFYGYYEIPLEDDWKGIIRAQPTEWFDSVSPGEIGCTVTSDISGQDFTATHTGEAWTAEWATGIPICVLSNASSAPSMIGDGAGGSMSTWQDQRSDAGDIYAQRMDGEGNLLWTANGGLVAAETGIQGPPVIAMDGTGGGIAVWKDLRSGSADLYYQQVFPGGGIRWSGGKALCNAGGAQQHPRITNTTDGSWIVVWDDSRGNASEIYAQRILPDGTQAWAQNGVPVTQEHYIAPGRNTPGGYFNKSSPALMDDGSGGALIVWRNAKPVYVNGSPSEEYSIRTLRLSADGTIPWGPAGGQGVILGDNTSLTDPVVVPANTGGALAAYVHNTTISVTFIDLGGGSVGGTFSPVSNQQFGSQLDFISDGAGNALLTFVDQSSHLLVQRFDASGRVWSADLVAGDAENVQGAPRMCSAGNGTYFICWADQRSTDPGVYVQKIEVGSESVLWEQNGVPIALGSDLKNPAVVQLGADRASAVWSSNYGVYGQLIQDLDIHAHVTTNVPGNGFLFTCPAGSEDNGASSEFQVNVEIHDDHRFTFDPSNIDLNLQLPTSGPIAFFSENPGDPVWSTSGNVLSTTVGRWNIGGFGPYEIPVLVNGMEVGQAFVSVRSPDFDADGDVDGDDYQFFADNYASPPKPYEPRADLDGDGLVNSADFTLFGGHYGHTNGGSASPKVAGKLQARTQLAFRVAQPGGDGKTTLLDVSLEDPEPFDRMILAVAVDNEGLQFEGWTPSGPFKGTRIVTATTLDGKQVLLIGVWGGRVTGERTLELGTITMGARKEALAADELGVHLVYGDVVTSNGEVLRIGGVQVKDGRSGVIPVRNLLTQNYPNPFSLGTTIEYSLASRGHVDLLIFNVSGQVVRTLVDEDREPNLYRMTWDGRNNQGGRVAPGMYFYQIRTKEFTSTKRMVLLR